MVALEVLDVGRAVSYVYICHFREVAFMLLYQRFAVQYQYLAAE